MPFRSGVDVLIATPGRLLDHMKAPYTKLDHIEFLVLDEADRMLDMGFLPDIKRILRSLPAKRQTLFFSATMPPPIAALTREMLKNPVTINVERQAAPASGITQAVYPVPQELKSALLLELLNAERAAGGAGVHPHQAPRQPAVPAAGEGRHRGRPHPRQPLAAAAHGGARRVQEGLHPRAGGHRHRRSAASTSRRSGTW